MTFALLLLGIACSPARQALREERQQERQTLREQRLLTQVAEEYWQALRWQRLSVAAAWIEDDQRRLDWVEEHAALGFRYRAADVLHVQVGEELDPPEERRLREGTVTVRVEGFEEADQVLRKEVLSQEWYRTDTGWWVQPTQEEGMPAGL